jgi:hypothetical protein
MERQERSRNRKMEGRSAGARLATRPFEKETELLEINTKEQRIG